VADNFLQLCAACNPMDRERPRR